MSKILYIDDKPEWNAYVSRAVEYDFYHTWHYHTLDTTGTPLLFIYENDEGFIGLPLIKRSIPGSAYYDLTSVYGYTGPISNLAMHCIPESLIAAFKTEFVNFLADGKFVSVFSRLTPFYQQTNILHRFGGLHDNGLTVVMDLSVDDDTRRKGYRNSTLPTLRQAWKMGVVVREEKGPRAVSTFTSIYLENMKHVGASETYMFNEDHFNKLLNTDEYDARVMLVYHGDNVMAGSIVTFTNGVMQAYLIGTRNEYRKYSPSKLLVDEICLLGKKMGMKYYNLGGGVGFKEDSLFTWKAAFSNLLLPYKTWRYIANPTIYNALLEERGIDKNSDIDFFPLYRSA
ncbi:MAG TPA: GNAT family N-acetyltransferase [Mucilaginibacter sp.]|jgi:hypothetical protein|nr:GNAT family N-acetyltransferase [Mucilaginibacter sp.]